jgi:hypothetical protein
MAKQFARNALVLGSLIALGACGSSSPTPAKTGQAGSAGGKAGTGGGAGMTGAAGTGGDSGATGTAGGAAGAIGGAQMIGPSGGTVTMNNLTLTIPAGALAANTMITVAPTAAPADYDLASTAYEFGPEGTTFAAPVTITIPLPSPAPDAHLFWSNASGGFDDLGGTVTDTTLTGMVTHFSKGFAAHGKKADGGATDAAGGSGGVAGAGGSAGGSAGAGGSADAGGSAGAAGAAAAGSSGTDAGASNDAGGSSDAAAAPDSGSSGSDAAGSDAGSASDAGGGGDAASLCNSAFAVNLPVVTPTIINDGSVAPAGSTYVGGTFGSGISFMTGVTHYGATYSGPSRAEYIWDTVAQTIRIGEVVGQATYYTGISYQFSDAHTIVGTVVCTTLLNAPLQRIWYFSVGQKLVLSPAGSQDVPVFGVPLPPA